MNRESPTTTTTTALKFMDPSWARCRSSCCVACLLLSHQRSNLTSLRFLLLCTLTSRSRSHDDAIIWVHIITLDEPHLLRNGMKRNIRASTWFTIKITIYMLKLHSSKLRELRHSLNIFFITPLILLRCSHDSLRWSVWWRLVLSCRARAHHEFYYY